MVRCCALWDIHENGVSPAWSIVWPRSFPDSRTCRSSTVDRRASGISLPLWQKVVRSIGRVKIRVTMKFPRDAICGISRRKCLLRRFTPLKKYNPAMCKTDLWFWLHVSFPIEILDEFVEKKYCNFPTWHRSSFLTPELPGSGQND